MKFASATPETRERLPGDRRPQTSGRYAQDGRSRSFINFAPLDNVITSLRKLPEGYKKAPTMARARRSDEGFRFGAGLGSSSDGKRTAVDNPTGCLTQFQA
jgi:hypothetical protein